jgi:hypothetical protein
MDARYARPLRLVRAPVCFGLLRQLDPLFGKSDQFVSTGTIRQPCHVNAVLSFPAVLLGEKFEACVMTAGHENEWDMIPGTSTLTYVSGAFAFRDFTQPIHRYPLNSRSVRSPCRARRLRAAAAPTVEIRSGRARPSLNRPAAVGGPTHIPLAGGRHQRAADGKGRSGRSPERGNGNERAARTFPVLIESEPKL